MAPSESSRREIPSSNVDSFLRILDLMENSLQQDILERQALGSVRDVEEAPHSRPVLRNSIRQEEEDDLDDGSYFSHPRNSSVATSQRLTPRYLPSRRRESGWYVVRRHPSERSSYEDTVRFQTPATNEASDEVNTMERHAGQGRSSASQRREPSLTLRFQAPPKHSNQSSISGTVSPQSISRRPQYGPYWPLGNTASHANRRSNGASRASTLPQVSENTEQLRVMNGTRTMTTSSLVLGEGKRRNLRNGASTQDALQHAREAEAS